MEITATVVRKFTPVTITLNTEAEVANVVGALAAYGSANTFAENTLKDIGLGQFYSGNVRKAARNISLELAGAIGGNVEQLKARFEAYKKSPLGQSSHPSAAGSAIAGTSEDLAPGREATSFESTVTSAATADEFDEDDNDSGCSCDACRNS